MFKVICGIYKIQSKIKPERIYIGSSINMKLRWSIHRQGLYKNKHDSPQLQNHYNKYGIDDLCFNIVEQFDFISKKHLLDRENYYIKEFKYLNTRKPYFNSALQAESCLGIKRSELARENYRKALRGRKLSEEQKRKLSETKRNDPKTMDQIKKLAQINKGNKYAQRCTWNIGRKHTDIARKHMSKAQKGITRPKSRGVKFTEEHKNKISIALKGKKKSPEHIKHMSEYMKGRPSKIKGIKRSTEIKNKLSKVKKGLFKICKYCDGTFNIMPYNIYHNKRCKKYINYEQAAI